MKEPQRRLSFWFLFFLASILSPLLAGGSLTFAQDTIVDNTNASATARTGSWAVSGASGQYGSDSVWARGGDDTFTFYFTPTEGGSYDVWEWHSPWSTRTTAARHRITYQGGSRTISVNQQLNGGKWNKLGTFALQARVRYSVVITSTVSTTASTCADAIRWTPVQSGNVAPTAVIDSITPSPATQGQSVAFRGHGTDSDGTIAAYRWSSSINGNLGSTKDVDAALATAGTHTISYEVQDDDGAWSTAATRTLTVNAGTGAAENVYFCLGYGAGKTAKANVQNLLKNIGATQVGSEWRYTNAKNKKFVFRFAETLDAMRNALYEQGAHVIYKGHANYGLGALFATATEQTNQRVNNIYTINDPRIFNISSPWMHVSVRGLRTSQAFPNWWPEFSNGESGIMPYTFKEGAPAYNYYIPYQLGSATYTARRVGGEGIQRFPDSGKPAWDFEDGPQPPAGSDSYITNDTPWTRSLEVTGNWINAYDLEGLFRDDYLHIAAGSASNQVKYFFTIPRPEGALGARAQHRVFAWWPASTSNTTGARYIVNHATGSTTVTANQRLNGGQWNEIGQFPFDYDEEYSVVVSGAAGSSGRVVADGVRISALENPTAVIQADFVAEDRYGIAPFEVTFESTSTGDISTYEWNFGDGGTNNSRTYITHTYTKAGRYNVSFTVNGPEGTSTRTKTAYIVVGSGVDELRAEFSARGESGTAPLTVQFNDESSGTVTHWKWEFIRPGYPTETLQGSDPDVHKNPVHTFADPDNYTVRLTVNGTSTETKTNFVVARRFDKIMDNVDYPMAHYRSKTLIFRRAGDFEIDKSRLGYARLYYEACNSGNYYLDTFNRGIVFYTLNTANGLAFSPYVRGYVAGKTDLKIWQDMQAREPVYDYYDFNKKPSDQDNQDR